jgi:prevent-host-death family protein
MKPVGVLTRHSADARTADFPLEPRKPVGQRWALYDAKNKLSTVVRAAQSEPQVITVRGKEEAVVLSWDAWQVRKAKKQSAWDAMADSRLIASDIPEEAWDALDKSIEEDRTLPLRGHPFDFGDDDE